MNKIAIIYWSGSGNTEAMANAIKTGVDGAGVPCDLYFVSDFDVASINDYDGLILGCPAMGAEVLEECEFQPVFDEMINSLNGKSVALFGSYGWGDGEWMRHWEETCRNDGAVLSTESVICNGMPDDEAIGQCRALGQSLV